VLFRDASGQITEDSGPDLGPRAALAARTAAVRLEADVGLAPALQIAQSVR
jgi:hypothetical protein